MITYIEIRIFTRDSYNLGIFKIVDHISNIMNLYLFTFVQMPDSSDNWGVCYPEFDPGEMPEEKVGRIC